MRAIVAVVLSFSLLGSVFAQDGVVNPQTNASALTTGTVAAARGGAGTINGALKANGSGVVSQAACADLSNAAASCSTDATNANNLNSGTVPAGRMPAFTGDTTTSAGSVATTTTKINGVDQTTAWTTYTPTVACTTSGTITADSVSGRYKTIGKTTFFELFLNITTLGTCLGNVTLTIQGTSASTTSVSAYNSSTATSVPAVISFGTGIVTLAFVTAPAANTYVIGGLYEQQ